MLKTKTFPCLFFICLLLSHSIAAHQLTIERINAKNADTLSVDGPDAIGGINDWFLSNGTLCAIFSDVSHENDFSTSGGALIDLSHCHRKGDFFISNQDFLNGKQNRFFHNYRIETQQNKHDVSLTTFGQRDGIHAEIRYSMNATQKNHINVFKRFTRIHRSKEENTNFITPILFNYHSLEPFILSTITPSNSTGFATENVTRRGLSALRSAAKPSDTIVLVGDAHTPEPTSYGWQLISAKKRSQNTLTALPHYMLADDEASLMLIMNDDYYIGSTQSMGWAQLLQIKLLELDIGEEILIKERIYVGEGADVATISNQIFAAAPLVFGRTNVANSAIHVNLKSGTPFTFVRPKTDGRFAFRLPKGDYSLRFISSDGQTQTHDIVVNKPTIDMGNIAFSSPAELVLPRGNAMRLVFTGIEGTRNPNLADSLTQSSVLDVNGVRYKPEVNQIFLSGHESDPKSVALPAGKYRVYATKGLEFSVQSTEINMQIGDTVTLDIATPKRVVSTPNFIAADLHVHSGASFDNTFSSLERVRTFLAEGGEVLVASDHDIPYDYSDEINFLDANDALTSIVGVELTSIIQSEATPHTNGHLNFFPTTIKKNEYRRGLPNHENRRMRDILHNIKKHNSNALIQLNHPRTTINWESISPDDYQNHIDNGAFFEHMGIAATPYKPSKSLKQKPNSVLIEKDPNTKFRDIDFDIIEVFNPGGENPFERLQTVRKDWISLLLQGERITGSANSDSHTPYEVVAVPRTMVSVNNDNPAQLNLKDFLTSLKVGNAYGTSGPFFNIDLNGVSMGKVFSGKTATVNITLQSAPWVSIDSLNIQINGKSHKKLHIPPLNGKSHTISETLSFDKDSIVTIELFGTPNGTYLTLYPKLFPYAFSNPIYVDYNADGIWSPPNL